MISEISKNECPISPREDFRILSQFKIDKNDKIDQFTCDFWQIPRNCKKLTFQAKKSLKEYCYNEKRNKLFDEVNKLAVDNFVWYFMLGIFVFLLFLVTYILGSKIVI